MRIPVARLDSVADVRLGRQRSPKNHIGTNMRPYVRAANVGWDGLLLDDINTMHFSDHEMVVYGLKRGDLLLGEASGSAAEVGKPALWNGEIEDCAFQNTLIRVRSRGPEPRYLLHYFRYQAESGEFAAQSRGVGIYHLGRQALASWLIPIPPVQKQRQIIEVLDRTDELRIKGRQALDLISGLARSVFIHMFGNPRDRSERWPLHSIGELCEVRGGKRLPKGSDYSPISSPHRYIRVADIRYGEVNEASLRYIDAAVQRRISRYVVHKGDVIISIAGTIGLIAPVRAAVDGVNLTENAAKLVPRVPGRYTAGYLSEVLRSAAMQAQIDQQTGRVTIGKLALFRVEKIIIPIPPLYLQEEFDHRVAIIAENVLRERRHLAELDDLYSSLQQRAFAGRL